MSIRLTTLMLALGLSLPAHAAFTGAELLKRCSASEKSIQGERLSPDEALDAMWCVGYMTGLLDGFGVADYKVADRRMVCPAESGLTRSDALGVITRYLREHPEEQQKNGRRTALLALSRAYPCQ